MFRLLLVFVFVTNIFAYDVIKGTTFLLKLKNADEKVFKDGVELVKLKHPTKKDSYFVLVPVAYKTKEKTIELLRKNQNNTSTISLHVKDGNYPKETLKVNPKKVKPPKEEENRIYKEYLESKKIYATFTPKRYWKEPFEKPMSSKITSSYGNARVFNGSLKSFHSGTDFRAPTGSVIRVVNDGVVVVASNRYYSGNAIIVDHGEGIYSSYSHLSKIDVKVGQKVSKHEKLGLSGATGRVTGPHLHFSIILQSKKIDPLDFIVKINNLY
ncbi:M23 family metallopeptidase [Sulfurospirillum arcachonense]|uniref:M23 family metallopeptidase n=1 Tax=Sulfurospirillum arcachonense TaxID=57666 RepID=UPI0004691C26|nr:M23 family metallopeptidase [Sulfurospirillum arcachonense]